MADRWFDVELSLRGTIRVKLDGDLYDDCDLQYIHQDAFEHAAEEASWDWTKLNADWEVEEIWETNEAGDDLV